MSEERLCIIRNKPLTQCSHVGSSISYKETVNGESNGKSMKVIYIAGPYRDTRGEWFIQKNIRLAERYALDVWRMGAVALCPHKNTAFFGGAMGDKADDNVWLKGDIELLSRCDALLTTHNWECSWGARREVAYAEKNGIPVFFGLEDLKKWLHS